MNSEANRSCNLNIHGMEEEAINGSARISATYHNVGESCNSITGSLMTIKQETDVMHPASSLSFTCKSEPEESWMGQAIKSEEIDIDEMKIEPPEEDEEQSLCHNDVIQYGESPEIPGKLQLVRSSQSTAGYRKESLKTEKTLDFSMALYLSSIFSNVKTFQCDVCSKSFPRKSTLAYHTMMHNGEKPFKCDHCPKRFTQKNSVKNHLRIHSGEKPYKCGLCSYSCAQNSALINHRRVHTGEKPFECDRCSKRFSAKSTLVNHCRIHRGEKPFECDQCSKRFTVKRSLDSHRRIHSDEKPFKCDQCSKKFSEESYLVTHCLIHSEDKPFKCDQCSKSFNRKHYLTAHSWVHLKSLPDAIYAPIAPLKKKS